MTADTEKKAAMERGIRGQAARWMSVALLAVLIVSVAAAAHAGPDVDAGMFRQGAVRASIRLGSGTAFDRDYSIIGVGIGYYVIDGLEAGIDIESWQGSGPNITQVSPAVRYVFTSAGSVKPYGGTVYTRTFIEGHSDTNTAGLRAGALFLSGRRAYVGAGVAHDIHLNCDRTVYSSCTDTYPELLIAVLF